MQTATDITTLSPTELLRFFGFPTSVEEDQVSDLRKRFCKEGTDEEKQRRFYGSLTDTQFRDLTMDFMMNTYAFLFTNKSKPSEGPMCGVCGPTGQRIILPIDLRREGGENFHGACYGRKLHSEVRARKLSLHHNNPETLEHFLRVARLCTPSTGSILNLFELADEGIDTREKLNEFYWEGPKA